MYIDANLGLGAVGGLLLLLLTAHRMGASRRVDPAMVRDVAAALIAAGFQPPATPAAGTPSPSGPGDPTRPKGSDAPIPQGPVMPELAPSGAVPSPDSVKRLVGSRYTVLGELGRGGMAIVYRARDEALGREVALKFLTSGAGPDDLMQDFFQREARAAAALNHPNIVAIYDFGVVSGRPYLSLELVNGVTVAAMIGERGTLAVLETLEIAEQVLVALEHAHGMGIVHRDIKPANVMVSAEGQVKLMDFGLAKPMGHKSTLLSGTPAYMSPEHLAGHPVDARTDIFSLGVSLYEMLSGRRPFEGVRRDKMPPSVRGINGSVPRVVDVAILRALDPERDRRFASAAEMLVPLRTVLGSVREFQQKRGSGRMPAIRTDPS